jgi:hypothetical protein
MKTIDELQGQDLHWVQPSLMQPTYELRTTTGGTVARVARSGMLNAVDEVEAAGGRYRIAHKGLINRYFEICPVNGDAQPPLYVFQHTGATLTLPNGERVLWKKVGQANSARWEWVRADGTRLMSLTSGGGERITSHLCWELGAADAGTRLLLAMLGAYLILLYSDEAE